MKESLNKLLILSYLTSLDLNGSKKIIQKVYQKSFLEIKGMSSEESFLFLCKKLVHRIEKADLTSENEFRSVWSTLFSHVDTSFDNEHWYELYSNSNVEERKTFVLSQVLKVDDQSIAELLGVSLGTIKYRISSCYQVISRSLKYA